MGEDDQWRPEILLSMRRKRTLTLTEEGVEEGRAVSSILRTWQIRRTWRSSIIWILALRAHNLMFRDKDYVVKDDQVLIVDEFTGRIMPGRRYSRRTSSGD